MCQRLELEVPKAGSIPLIIRCGVTSDAERLINYSKQVLADSDWSVTQLHEYDFTKEQVTKWIKDHYEKPGQLLLIAESGGEIVGMLDFANYHRERNQHVGSFGMSVHKKFRGRGVGKALLQTLLEWARRNPLVEKVALAVFSTNTPALQLYGKAGFNEEGRRQREHQLSDGVYVDDVLMYCFTNEVKPMP
jgi:RimJ/RimL family protein N-acetyltransferase